MELRNRSQIEEDELGKWQIGGVYSAVFDAAAFLGRFIHSQNLFRRKNTFASVASGHLVTGLASEMNARFIKSGLTLSRLFKSFDRSNEGMIDKVNRVLVCLRLSHPGTCLL